MLYESQTSRTIVYDHRLIAGTMGIIFAAVSQCCPSESGEASVSEGCLHLYVSAVRSQNREESGVG